MTKYTGTLTKQSDGRAIWPYLCMPPLNGHERGQNLDTVFIMTLFGDGCLVDVSIDFEKQVLSIQARQPE